MTGMDLLAFLLWWQADVKELERLTRRLTELNYNDSRPESWIGLYQLDLDVKVTICEEYFVLF